MKQKKSFFERLTGSRRIQEDEKIEEYQDYNQSFKYQVDNLASQNIQTQINQEDYQPRSVNTNEQQLPSEGEENWIGESEGQLTIDVYQTDNDIIIKSTIAGVKPEDLDVSINNDMVTIRGERKNDEIVDSENYFYQECYWGAFSRSVILPVEVVAEKAEATMKNGILTLKLPKADTTKTRKIQVRGF